MRKQGMSRASLVKQASPANRAGSPHVSRPLITLDRKDQMERSYWYFHDRGECTTMKLYISSTFNKSFFHLVIIFFSVWGKERYNGHKIKAPTVASLSYWRDLKCPLEALGLVCTLNIQTRVLGEKI